MFCPYCGKPNNDNDSFCMECGSPLPSQPVVPKKKSKVKKVFISIGATLLALITFFMMQIIVTVVYYTVTGISYALNESSDPDESKTSEDIADEITELIYDNVIPISLISNLITILFICIFFRIKRQNPAEKLRIRLGNPLRLCTFAVFGASMNVFFNMILNLIIVPLMSKESIESFEKSNSFITGPNVLLMLFTIGLVTGITEELVFRVIPMTNLKPTIGKFAAVAISSVLFGLAHGNPLALTYTIPFGIICALIFDRYDSALPSIICHMFFNMTAVGLVYLPEQMLFPVFLFSIAGFAFCFYRIFIRYPTFSDVLTDKNVLLYPINNKEAEIYGEISALKASGNIKREDLERLDTEWTANRASFRRPRLYNAINKNKNNAAGNDSGGDGDNK